MTIKVFYMPEMVTNTTSYSPSASKPAKVIHDWIVRGLDIELKDFIPASFDMFADTHEPTHVSNVFKGITPNGFDNYDAGVSFSVRYTAGSMLAAAKYVLTAPVDEPAVACSPSSGFHHAGYDFCGGFCTFNGLVLTARQLIKSGLAKKVGILDLDYHYGNGTADLIKRHSMQGVLWHFTAGNRYTSPSDADDMLIALPKLISEAKEFGCDVLLYQAGADQHAEDPLGGLLTSTQLRMRDAIVFTQCRELKLPVVWNLAGGYQNPIEKVLTIHRNTMKECIHVYA